MSVLLAENQRTSIKAKIKRASQRARSAIKKLDKSVAQDLLEVYAIAREQLQTTIQQHAGNDGLVSLVVMRDIVDQIDQIIDTLAVQRDNLLGSALGRGARIGTGVFEDAIRASRIQAISDDAVRFVQHFVADDGLQLSSRLWRNTEQARTNVKLAVQSAIIQGHSASQAAQDFINRGVSIPAELSRNIKHSSAFNIANIAGRELMVNEDNAYAQAKRIFRTEINRAHGVAYENAAFEHPDVIGLRFLLSPNHPRVDICDMHASVNRYGLGPGVYPRDKSPWPAHPNTLSFQEVVFSDEVSEEDKNGKQDRIAWLNGQAPHVQSAVVGGRKKYAALKNGFLKEGEITTPWQVLKVKYQRKGIDVDGLQVTPDIIEAESGVKRSIQAVRQESRDYVLSKGLNSGWEHGHAFDVKTGHVFLRKTSRKPREISFSTRELQVFQNPRNNLELSHNHPSSSSLSGADLHFATQKGISRVVAVGHDGSVYSASVNEERKVFSRFYRDAEQIIRDEMWSLINKKVIAVDVANAVHAHLVNSLLSTSGLIDYTVEHFGDFAKKQIDRLPFDVELRVAELVKKLEL